ncbi:MAG: hypothetical protein APF77_06965 [Clostridia bacterium BRH_c25]|nr:MAG: hypothetical protein APF77_06965 [Clostridia bacterium BRH_c25]
MLKDKIVYKLTIGYVIIAVISLLIVGVFVINIFRNNTFQNKQNSMLERARQIASETESYINNADYRDEYSRLMSMIESFINSRVWILDANGNVLAKSKGALCGDKEIDDPKECPDSQFDIEIMKSTLNGNDIIREGQSGYYNEPVLVVGAPIYNRLRNVNGAVLLYSPITGITSSIDEAFTFLIMIIVITVILFSILSFYYSKLISKPINIMTASAIEMTKGNYSVRTNIRQKDEIGQLSNSLDLLASKLGYTIDQLFQEKNKVDNIISSISEGILAFDRNLKLLNYNTALWNVFEYLNTVDREQLIMQMLLDRGILDEFESVLETGNGSAIIVEWKNKVLKFTISPVKNNHEEIIGVVSLIQDISESERLEQMRKDFVANVSHEFRTPLTLIRGSIEALMDGAISKPDDVKRYQTRIFEEAKGLEKLVGDLLNFSRLQSGKAILELDNIDISDLITSISRSMQRIAKIKNITIITEVDQNIPAVIGDYDRLKQLFVIFLDNAIKFSPENTEIQIAAYVKDYVYVKISDNGYGIPKEDIPFVWERFYKVDKSRMKSDIGIGLGLSIAKYLIDLHKGVVKLESELNKGTTIKVGLPYIHDAESV